jgi:hypothetical protein
MSFFILYEDTIFVRIIILFNQEFKGENIIKALLYKYVNIFTLNYNLPYKEYSASWPVSLSLEVDVRLVVKVLLSDWPTDKTVVAVATLLLLVTLDVDIVTVDVVPGVVKLGKLWAPIRGEAKDKNEANQYK